MSLTPPAPPASPPLAIGILSGGLDSLLAARLIRSQGIRVLGYHFISPFFGWAKHGRETRAAAEFEERHGFEVRVRPVWPDYLEIVRHPRFGWGRNMNPCVDCKIFMLRLARVEMEKQGAAFVFTGEVLGQRPMSQRRDALHLIEKHSGLKGRLVRPLSSKLLPPTIPEREGILDREKLLDISGRSRKRQMELAAEFGIREYATPAGGCLLTDPAYSARLRKLLEEEARVDLVDVELLSIGRHFRLSPGSRLVVGRNQAENERLASLASPEDLILQTPDTPGPTSLLSGQAGEDEITLAVRITARYADHAGRDEVAVSITRAGKPLAGRLISPALPEEIEPFRL